MVYPPRVWERIARVGTDVEPNATAGRAASLECGCFVEFSLGINDGQVGTIGVRTNGCGYMLASADILMEAVESRELADLHGLNDEVLSRTIEDSIGRLPPERRQCAAVCIDALRTAFAEYRLRQVDEFRGEKALVCTCFGVTEETIDHLIASVQPRSVDDVTASCRAGGGCGSCRMLIQEMLDNA